MLSQRSELLEKWKQLIFHSKEKKETKQKTMPLIFIDIHLKNDLPSHLFQKFFWFTKHCPV